MSDISRRHLFQTAAVVAGAVGAAVAGVKAQPYPGEGGYSAPPQIGEEAQYARKQSKDEAEYQDYPNHGEHCEACANFWGPITAASSPVKSAQAAGAGISNRGRKAPVRYTGVCTSPTRRPRQYSQRGSETARVRLRTDLAARRLVANLERHAGQNEPACLTAKSAG